MLRRIVTLGLSLTLLLCLTTAGRLLAQDDPKKDAAPATEEQSKAKDQPAETKDQPAEAQEPAAETKDQPAETKDQPAQAEPEPSIPPEVEQKLEAARRAVAEAIVAAQDAGLVKTSIDPPPVLDILFTGRANDAEKLKTATTEKPEVGVSPEVFGAWFTGYGKLEGVTAEKNVRIINPSQGLKQWYDERARILNTYIDQVRKEKGQGQASPAETTTPEEPSTEPKPEETTTEPAAEESKPEADATTEETKPEADAATTEEPKPEGEQPKVEEESADEPQASR